MICKPEVLHRALTNYLGYQPTASLHLIQCRDHWIPCHIPDQASRDLVRELAECILKGRPYAKKYWRLPLEMQLGVCLCATQGWAEKVAGLRAKGGPRALKYTQRLFDHLAGVSVDFQAMSVRNWASRDGGSLAWTSVICEHKLTRVPVLMEVYVSIRRHWNRVGSDWDRRRRDEAAAAAR